MYIMTAQVNKLHFLY